MATTHDTRASLSWLRTLMAVAGPGLLMAGAAVGVSHLVQSTRAGANFGYQLLPLILLANVMKYPFFEFGHRYIAATGENLLTGYQRLGKGFVAVFLVLSIITAVGSIAAVSFVTAALVHHIIPIELSTTWWTGIIILICMLILTIGHYHVLDIGIKLLMAVLCIATVSAFVLALSHGSVASADFISPSPWNIATLPFIIALMGWMPGPVELSVWQSLWMEAKIKDTGHKPTLKEASLDFNFGYIITVVLAIMFLTLGSAIMHGSGETFSAKATSFSAQVISLYTQVIGDWAAPFIAIAAFTAMFSTSLTLIDAYPRSLAACNALLFPNNPAATNDRRGRFGWLLITSGLAFGVVFVFVQSLKTLVDVVTIIAFLAAPVFAYMNFKLISSDHIPEEAKPRNSLKWLSILGLVYLVGFALLYLAYQAGLVT